MIIQYNYINIYFYKTIKILFFATPLRLIFSIFLMISYI